MVILPKSVEELQYLHAFLAERGVKLDPEPNLRMLAHGTWAHPRKVNAVVAYNGFSGRTCCMHIAGDRGRWLDRQFLYAGFHYPFVVCDLVTIFAYVAGNNEAALNFDRRIGFREATVIEDGWEAGTSLHILRMDRKDCRWLKEAYNVQGHRKAA